ncbi:MAG: lysophospholipid acyltransferase family protein [Deltaproteobacteria bacterium]|nr:lysophospholipid acyltransferase family protein [Deltaproteobacteria bacterium]
MTGPLPIGRRRGETLWQIWRRRLLSIPFVLFLFALVWGLAPAWLLLAGLADLAGAGRRRAGKLRAVLFFGLYLGLEAAGLLSAGAIWLRAHGGRLGGHARYLERNRILQRWWSDHLFGGALRIYGMTLEVEGAAEVLPPPFLLWVRHASTADTVLAAFVLANPHDLLLRYVLKEELLWDPCLDVVGRRLPNAFVDRSGRRSEEAVAAVAGLGRDLDDRSGVLIFPEGTRFSPAKRERALARLREAGEAALVERAEALHHVLPPRLGGVLALLEAAPKTDVVILAHTGFEGVESFAEFFGGALVGRRLRVRLWRIPAASIPAEGRAAWVFERWAEVEAWVATSLELL